MNPFRFIIEKTYDFEKEEYWLRIVQELTFISYVGKQMWLNKMIQQLDLCWLKIDLVSVDHVHLVHIDLVSVNRVPHFFYV